MMPRVASAAGAERRKAVILTTTSEIGGVERVACNLARELTQREWSVDAVFPRTPKSDALLSWCQEQGVKASAHAAVLEVQAPHTVQSMAKLLQYVRTADADIINLQYGSNFISLKDVLAVRLAGRRHRCVATVFHPEPWGEENAKKREMTRRAAKLCDAVLTISRSTKEILQEAGVPQEKIGYLPMGLQVPESLPDPAEVRGRLGIAPETFVVGTLARLVPHKGIADLIQAVARIRGGKDAAPLKLLIAGDGPERAALEELAAALPGDAVSFLGRVKDTADLYAACDVFALPSYLEGFGLVYVEAAFHGVPSIGTNVGGIPDAIEDGKTGLLVAPGDIDALAAAIRRLRRYPKVRRELGQAARSRALTEFTDRVMADRFVEVCNRI